MQWFFYLEKKKQVNSKGEAQAREKNRELCCVKCNTKMYADTYMQLKQKIIIQ